MTKDKLIPLLVICITIVLTSFLLTRVNLYIKWWNTSSAIDNTISVMWDGKIFVTPDMLLLNIAVEETKSTTAEAQKIVNQKIDQIKAILKDQKIKDNDIKTKNISIYPEYDYRNSWRKLIWYRASHYMEIKIKSVDLENEWVAGKLLDDISKIGWVMINDISYDIDDKSPHYTQARQMAMEKAKQKAKELADIAGVKLSKPVSISENMDIYYTNPMSRNYIMKEMATAWWDMVLSDSADISLWQMEINLNVSVMYGIE